MSKLDELIAQCQAAPDDDAPRLAWAAEFGGERGELVEVQCRLASGAVTNRDEWRKLRARERELLAAHGSEWSGLARENPCVRIFRRGFVDAVQIMCSWDNRLDGILAKLPLARSVANRLASTEYAERRFSNPRCIQFAALSIDSNHIQHLVDHRVVLRALSVTTCTREQAHLLAGSGLLDRVERLSLGSVEDGEQIVAAAPRLRALHIGELDRYATAIPRTLVELRCSVTGGLDAVAALAIAPTLERLRVAAVDFGWDFETLASFRALRSLDLRDAKTGPTYMPYSIDRSGLLPSLRELSLGREFDEKSVEALARAFGSQLDTLHWTGPMPDHRQGAKAIMGDLDAPLRAGDARIAAHVDGEFVIGFRPPWWVRPLQYGDDPRAPWFEGGVVSLR